MRYVINRGQFALHSERVYHLVARRCTTSSILISECRADRKWYAIVKVTNQLKIVSEYI